MKVRNIAGRHGAFTTQFSKQPQMFAFSGSNLTNPLTSTSSPPPPPPRRSANKEVRTIERSRKAIERRLLLPLDEHNWIRALEVLRSNYARPGLKPEYYQRVLRAMVEPYIKTQFSLCKPEQTRNNYVDKASLERSKKVNHLQNVAMTNVSNNTTVNTHYDTCSNKQYNNEELLDMEKKWESKAYTQATVSAANAFDLSNGCGNVVEGIGQIRDAVFANEIPTSASLWITLIWAYVNMNRPLEAKETIELALRRFAFSQETIMHMLRLVYPSLCMTGEFTSVKELLALIEEWQREHEDKKKTRYNFDKFNKESNNYTESKESSTSNNLIKTFLMTSEAKRLYAEAAALEGSWQFALETMHECLTMKSHTHEQTSVNELNALFTTTATIPTTNKNVHSIAEHSYDEHSSTMHEYHAKPEPTSFPATLKTSKHVCLQFFSKEALSRLLTSFCVENEVELACTCWNELYGTLHVLPSLQEEEQEKLLLQHKCSPQTNIVALPTVDHIHHMLNCLCANGQVNVAIDLFVILFLPSSTHQRSNPESKHSTERFHFPLDAISLNIIFSAFITREVNLQELDNEAVVLVCDNNTLDSGNVSNSPLSSFSLRVATEPQRVVNLFNQLINMREDMQITDYVMAVVGPALVLTALSSDNNSIVENNNSNNEEKKSEYDTEKARNTKCKKNNLERLVPLLCQTPLLNTRKVPVHKSLQHRTLKDHLMTLVYYCYFSRLSSDEVRGELLHSLPHLFPPEYFCGDVNRLVKMQNAHTNTQNKHHQVKNSNTILHHKLNVMAHNKNNNGNLVCDNVDSKQTHVLDEVERMKQKWSHERKESPTLQASVEEHQSWRQWGRRERHHYFPLTSTARLTEQSEIEMKNNFANLYKNRLHAFHGTHSAANNDPRPIPKGIHDRASGWNFVGRNGEMMFNNNYRATNLLNMQPKVMRSLANPHRSWNPRLNSSLAHMELVKKWNKNSAMEARN